MTSFGDAGYMAVFSRDNVVDEDEVQQAHPSGVEPIPAALKESFIVVFRILLYVVPHAGQ